MCIWLRTADRKKISHHIAGDNTEAMHAVSFPIYDRMDTPQHRPSLVAPTVINVDLAGSNVSRQLPKITASFWDLLIEKHKSHNHVVGGSADVCTSENTNLED